MANPKLFLSLQRLFDQIGKETHLDDGTELYCLERRQGFVTVLSQDLIREATWPAKSTHSIPLDLATAARRAVLGAMTDGRALWREHLLYDNERATGVATEAIVQFLAKHDIALQVPEDKLCLSHSELVDLAREQKLPIQIIW